jgi:hypothetical protein
MQPFYFYYFLCTSCIIVLKVLRLADISVLVIDKTLGKFCMYFSFIYVQKGF